MNLLRNQVWKFEPQRTQRLKAVTTKIAKDMRSPRRKPDETTEDTEGILTLRTQRIKTPSGLSYRMVVTTSETGRSQSGTALPQRSRRLREAREDNQRGSWGKNGDRHDHKEHDHDRRRHDCVGQEAYVV